ncbi:MAG: hypothetical protein KGN33_08870 [Paracoccaceae bacterium]|nr:hypothetical protein [Paracoccaceae bacterium]
MWFGFSTHHRDENADGVGSGLSHYFFDEFVLKKTPHGSALVRRTPAPEILFGDAALFRATVRAPSWKNVYRSCVISFAKEDVDVEAFNAGDAGEREKIASVLALFMQALFPGIPERARPQVLIGTHTHTGRLELNVSVPQLLWGADGKCRAWNPSPPGRTERLFEAFQDLVNVRFEMSDPGDPRRRQLVAGKHWQMKASAEGRRTSLDLAKFDVEFVLEDLRKDVRAGRIRSKFDVTERLTAEGEKFGWQVLGSSKTTITIGAADGDVKDRTRLRGLICDEDFDGTGIDLTSEGMQRRVAARQSTLRSASKRFAEEWHHVAAFNRSRHGLDRWEEVAFDPDAWLRGEEPSLRHRIPRAHQDHLLQFDVRNDMETLLDDARPDFSDGAPVARGISEKSRRAAIASGPDRRSSEAVGGSTAADADARGRDGSDPLSFGQVLLAERIKLIADAIRKSVAWAHKAIDNVYALRMADRYVSQGALINFHRLISILEQNNARRPTDATAANSVNRAFAGNRAIDAGGHPSRLAPFREEGGQRGQEVRGIDRGHVVDQHWSRADGRGVPGERRETGGFGESPDIADTTSGYARAAGQGDIGNIEQGEDAPRLDGGRRLRAPNRSRAERFAKIRAALMEVLPGTPVFVRPTGKNFLVSCKDRIELIVRSTAVEIRRHDVRGVAARLKIVIEMAVGLRPRSLPTPEEVSSRQKGQQDLLPSQQGHGKVSDETGLVPRSARSKPSIQETKPQLPRFVFVHDQGALRASAKQRSGLDGELTVWARIETLSDPSLPARLQDVARTHRGVECYLVGRKRNQVAIEVLSRWLHVKSLAGDNAVFEILDADKTGAIKRPPGVDAHGVETPTVMDERDMDDPSDMNELGPDDPRPYG